MNLTVLISQWKIYLYAVDVSFLSLFSSYSLYLLANALDIMSCCHSAYFCKGWKEARGCLIEHQAAKAYGLEIIYEE